MPAGGAGGERRVPCVEAPVFAGAVGIVAERMAAIGRIVQVLRHPGLATDLHELVDLAVAAVLEFAVELEQDCVQLADDFIVGRLRNHGLAGLGGSLPEVVVGRLDPAVVFGADELVVRAVVGHDRSDGIGGSLCHEGRAGGRGGSKASQGKREGNGSHVSSFVVVCGN